LKGGDNLEENKKMGQINMSLNSLNTVSDDPTILKGQVIIFDFEKSGNNQIITKEIAEQNMQTLIGKRICCKYITKSENGGQLDALGSHEQYQTINRNDEDVIYTNTEAIGFIDNVYIDNYTDKNNITREAVFGDVILWCDDHYADIIGLLQEWLSRNIHINFSVEYYYFNYSIQNGIEYISSPIIFNAHTALNSEDRGNAIEVLPSYECATLTSLNELNNQWNKALNNLNSVNKINDIKVEPNNNDLKSSENLDLNIIKNNNQKEEKQVMENMFLNAMKSNNELSFGDVRDSLYNALASVMIAEEYFNVWISSYGVYEEYFIYETMEDSKWVNYKVSYTKNADDTVTIDYASKVQVTYSSAIVEISDMESSLNAKDKELETSKKELNEATSTIEKLNNEIKSLNEKVVEKSNNSQADLDKFNDLTNKIVALNSMVDQMKPIVEKYNSETFEKSLNEAKESYKDKFSKVNALDIFEVESTQSLIKESINSDEKIAMKAKYSLNELIVNNIKLEETNVDSDDLLSSTPKISINQVTKIEDENKDLINEKELALQEYGLNYD
jgi:hypothetical protein